MGTYSQRWRAFNTNVQVGTTQADRLGPASDAVRAVLFELGPTDRAAVADLAAEAAMRAARHGGVLLSLGADVVTAGDAPAGGWQLSIREMAEDKDAVLDDGVIAIRRGAIATSTTTSPSQWRSVTVAARSCVDAETAAGAAISRGDCAIGWLERRRLAARLVETDGTVHYIGRWPDPSRDAA